MALRDELEARQTKKRKTGTRLTKSALEALTIAETPEEFDPLWKRVVANFDVLIDRGEAVEGLRRTICGLACRGALTLRTSGSTKEVLLAIRDRREAWVREHAVQGDREPGRHAAKVEAQAAVPPERQLPRGWAWATLLQCSMQLVDCHNKTAPYTSAGIMLVRTSNVRDGKVRLEGAKYVSPETYAFWSRRCPPLPGDLLFTREAPMGEVGLIEPGMKLCMGQRMMLLRVAPDLIDPQYLVIAMRDPAFLQRMHSAAVGSTVKHLRVGDVEALCGDEVEEAREEPEAVGGGSQRPQSRALQVLYALAVDKRVQGQVDILDDPSHAELRTLLEAHKAPRPDGAGPL